MRTICQTSNVKTTGTQQRNIIPALELPLPMCMTSEKNGRPVNVVYINVSMPMFSLSLSMSNFISSVIVAAS